LDISSAMHKKKGGVGERGERFEHAGDRGYHRYDRGERGERFERGGSNYQRSGGRYLANNSQFLRSHLFSMLATTFLFFFCLGVVATAAEVEGVVATATSTGTWSATPQFYMT
jgi:hypothetical protein